MTTAFHVRARNVSVRLQRVCAIFSCAALLGVSPLATHAQNAATAALPGIGAPAGSINCGPRTVNGTWRDGAIYGDASALASKSLQSVASGWCSYLGTGIFAESSDFFAQWIETQQTENLPLDIGVEWARQQLLDTRVRFGVVQTDTTNKERFFVTTIFESQNGAEWRTVGVHRVSAYVYKDTVRFESAVSPRLGFAPRWIASPMQLIRLDTGAVDQKRADAAALYVTEVRKRLGIATPAGEQVSYFYSKSGNGSAMVGFSELNVSMDGYTSKSPKLVFANVRDAGELDRNELVRVALMAYMPALSTPFETALAYALGGVRNRTWAQTVCEDRAQVFTREGVKDVAELIAKADVQLKDTNTRDWVNALLVDYLATKSGDAALRKLLSKDRNFATRASAQAEVASVLGIAPDVLMKTVAEYNASAAIEQRCNKK